jgi:hypothetical protein
MPLPPVTPEEADYLGEIYAKAADQYLISYLILTRFPESNPYALGFVLAHCIEVSVKAVIFHLTKQAPPTGQKGHLLEELLKLLPNDLKTELESHLPKDTTREHFLREVDDMHKAPPLKMLQTFFAINPEFDDDLWMMLYAMYFPVDIKYGADAGRNVLQPMQGDNPRLNKMALRLIACARERFPYTENHRGTLAEFVDKLPSKYSIVAEVQKLVATGTAEDTPAYITGDAPAPPLLFDTAELDLLRQTFGLPSKTTPSLAVSW